MAAASREARRRAVPSVPQALTAFLTSVRARARGEDGGTTIEEEERVPAQKSGDGRPVQERRGLRRPAALQLEVRAFEGSSMVGHPRAVVTPAIILACVAVYLVMVATGVHPLNPSAQVLLAWGAEASRRRSSSTGQTWRLFTCIFLHYGIVHLLSNMFVLAISGPLIERLFGHVAFAALYVLAGLAGSMASIRFHPVSIGAGASGAIFGVYGGLFGFLAIRRRAVPAAVLRPMIQWPVAFGLYSIIFSLVRPGHGPAGAPGRAGGGFPLRPGDDARRTRARTTPATLALTLRRLGAAAAVAAPLVFLSARSIRQARAAALEPPEPGPMLPEEQKRVKTFTAFSLSPT